jgi:hypothetical protein
MNEHDPVVLRRSLPEHGLLVGDVGAVAHVYAGARAFEVEFVSGDGETVAVITLEPADVRPLSDREILHVREISA